MFKNLRELIASIPDEKTCREYITQQRPFPCPLPKLWRHGVRRGKESEVLQPFRLFAL
jgi:hypothetical protein